MTPVTIAKADHSSVSLLVNPDSGEWTLQFVGALDEATAIESVIAHLGKFRTEVKILSLDLSGVENINSSGVRQWIPFMAWIRRSVPAFRFAKVCELFVSQASTVAGVLGSPPAAVLEFEVPYFCGSCKVRSTKYLKPADVPRVGRSAVAPAATCDTCHGPLEFDDVEDSYFRFLSAK